MNLLNHTPLAAGWTTMHDTSGAECLVVVVKGAYRLPLNGEDAELLERQVALTYADTATGEAGRSAPEYESDFCLSKPMVDILLLGTAYAPRGEPVQRVPVGMRVGAVSKSFFVTGKRTWRTRTFSALARPGQPQAFTQQVISYDIAYGGVAPGAKPDQKGAVYLSNPVGCGYVPYGSIAPDSALAQTEAADDPVCRPSGRYVPMSFGPLGRHWSPRVAYAGTYDAAWQADTYPFLPADFDPRYFQSAPSDQQLPKLEGGELVILVNLTHPALTPSGRLEFALPPLSLPMRLIGGKGASERVQPRVDTLLIEPDKQRFCVTWRFVRSMDNDPLRYQAVEIGERPKGRVTKIALEELLGELPSRQRGLREGGR